MASNQAKVFSFLFFWGGGVCACALDKGAPRRKWPSWPSALNPPLVSVNNIVDQSSCTWWSL